MKAESKKKFKLGKVRKNKRLDRLYEEYKRVRGQQYRMDGVFKELVAKRAGMTQTEMSCLGYLAEKGQTTPGELAKITGLTTGAITGLITRLEKKGCVTYVRDTKDKRKVIVKSVPKKIALVLLYYKPLSDKYYRLLSTFDEKHIEFLTYKSKCIVKMLQEEIERLSNDGHDKDHK
ncbi:MAG: MarR family transcriptional regulator [Patescibacteria group bacterium]